MLLVDISGVDSCRDSLSRFEFRRAIVSSLAFFVEASSEGQSPGTLGTDHLEKWRVYHRIIQANEEIETEAAKMTSVPTRVYRTRVILVLFSRPIHRGDELKAFQP